MDINGMIEIVTRLGVLTALLAWIVYYATKWGGQLVARHLLLVDQLIATLDELKQLTRSIKNDKVQ